jgi:hypothetical protein
MRNRYNRSSASAETQDLHEIVRERIAPHLPALAACRNSAELWGLDLYRALEPDIRRVLDTVGMWGRLSALRRPLRPPVPHYRFVAWNVERGAQFEGLVEALRTHPFCAKPTSCC